MRKGLCFLITALLVSETCYAINTQTKFWLLGRVTGSISDDHKFQYFLQPELRFTDNKYKFNQSLLWAGIGYMVKPNLIIYIGDAPDIIRNSEGIYRHQNILWQQENWTIIKNDHYILDHLSRLEEIKRLHQSSWQIVLRQQLSIIIPLPKWKNHALVISDTVFLNLKHPQWAPTNSFISQNRAFIGIETRLSPRVTNILGYMNQYEFYHPNQMSNIVHTTFNLEMG